MNAWILGRVFPNQIHGKPEPRRGSFGYTGLDGKKLLVNIYTTRLESFWRTR